MLFKGKLVVGSVGSVSSGAALSSSSPRLEPFSAAFVVAFELVCSSAEEERSSPLTKDPGEGRQADSENLLRESIAGWLNGTFAISEVLE